MECLFLIIWLTIIHILCFKMVHYKFSSYIPWQMILGVMSIVYKVQGIIPAQIMQNLEFIKLEHVSYIKPIWVSVSLENQETGLQESLL